jgi:hypothetical protein
MILLLDDEREGKGIDEAFKWMAKKYDGYF